jgi:hypothetical protein
MNRKKKMNNKETNRLKNIDHDNLEVIRPKEKFYDFKPLEDVMHLWVKDRE